MFYIYTKEKKPKIKFTVNLTREEVKELMGDNLFLDYPDLDKNNFIIIEQENMFKYPILGNDGIIREMTRDELVADGIEVQLNQGEKMKFKLHYYKSFEKSIHEKIDSICSSINETQNEDIISCYVMDISVFESYLDNICERLEKKEPSAMDGQVWGADFIEDRVYIYWVFDPDNEEGKAEISRKGMLKLMKKWIEFRKKKIPENYEEYEEIIEID